MALMYDRMFRETWNLPKPINGTEMVVNQAPYQKMRSEILEHLGACEVIRADNVANWFYEGSSQVDWDLIKDFPNLAPPFERCWIEYPAPTRLNANGKIQDAPIGLTVDRFGILILSSLVVGDNDERKGWFLTIMCFSETQQGIIGPVFEAKMYVDENGKIQKVPAFGGGVFGIKIMASYGLTPEQAKGLDSVIVLAHPALLTFCFLHCKNVDLITNEPPAKLSHAHLKRHKKPLVRFKTLDIQPIREILKHEGKSEETGLKKALHICRGHFKDFSKGKGLFGKYKGMYWWESQVRGSGIEGTVIKNYNVKRP